MKISVKVIPRSSRNEVQKQVDGSYRVYVTAAPVDGEANKKIIELLSRELGIAKSLFSIVKGTKSKNKVIEVGA